MAELIKLNGTPVRTAGLYRRMVAQDDGPPLEEVSLVMIVRGRTAHRAFQALLAPGQVSLELQGGPAFDVTVAATTHATSGGGEDAAYRHDVTLRETASSARRRAAAGADAAEAPDSTQSDAGAEGAGPEHADGLGAVSLSTSGAAWGAALRQMTAPQPAAATEPIPDPLAPAELAGIEAVLVGLRLEALIETLDRRGALRRSEIDDAFLRLIEERFVTEATPVVGDTVANRVVKDLLRG